MVLTRTIIKQSDQGIVGHIYEHMVAGYLTERLLQQGCMRLLDYDLSANTYDGIVVIRLETYSRRVLAFFSSLLESFTFDKEMVMTAIEQIECEYERLAVIDTPKLTKYLRALHATAWQEWKDFGVSKPIEDDGRNLMTGMGGFGQKRSTSFEHFDITYTIEHCPYELKTLAVYILQILSLCVIDKFSTDLKYCYDAGDEWAEYQVLVGYSHRVTARKSRHVSPRALQKYVDETYTLLCSDKVIKKIMRYIKRDRAQPFPYFNNESLFAKSYQLVGGAHMGMMVTSRNIQMVLEGIKMEVTRLDT